MHADIKGVFSLNCTYIGKCQRGHHSMSIELYFVMIEAKLQHLGSNNYKLVFHFVPDTGADTRIRSYAGT